MGVLTLLQLDESRHLGPEGVLAQTRQTLAEADQELLDLCLHELRAARTDGTRRGGAFQKKERNSPETKKATGRSAHLNLVACVSTVTENPSSPEVFLQVGYTWYLDSVRFSD